jgi:hypothetical protein
LSDRKEKHHDECHTHGFVVCNIKKLQDDMLINLVSDVATMRKTQDDKLQFFVLVLEARKKNKKKNTYFQSECSA